MTGQSIVYLLVIATYLRMTISLCQPHEITAPKTLCQTNAYVTSMYQPTLVERTQCDLPFFFFFLQYFYSKH